MVVLHEEAGLKVVLARGGEVARAVEEALGTGGPPPPGVPVGYLVGEQVVVAQGLAWLRRAREEGRPYLLGLLEVDPGYLEDGEEEGEEAPAPEEVRLPGGGGEGLQAAFGEGPLPAEAGAGSRAGPGALGEGAPGPGPPGGLVLLLPVFPELPLRLLLQGEGAYSRTSLSHLVVDLLGPPGGLHRLLQGGGHLQGLPEGERTRRAPGDPRGRSTGRGGR